MGGICEVCQSLMSKTGGDQSRNNYSLRTAAFIGHPECVEAFINLGADVNSWDLYFESTERLVRLVDPKYRDEIQLPKDLSITVDGVTPLISACSFGHEKCVKVLIAAGADVNKEVSCRTPLCEAAEMGREECVKLLIEAGADVNTVPLAGKPPVFHAVRSKNLSCLQTLINAGADVNKEISFRSHNYLRTPLHEALSLKLEECAWMLLKSGANFKSSDTKPDVLKPLHAAIGNVSIGLVKHLLCEGADVNSLHPEDGTTALIIALRRDELAWAKLLTEAGADVNASDKNGYFPLLYAKDYNALEFFLNAGADVNATLDSQSEERKTILFQEIQYGSAKVIRLFLRHDVQVNQRNYKGHNALEYGIEKEKIISRKFDHLLILYAAGESTSGDTIASTDCFFREIQIEVPKILRDLEKSPDLQLKDLCRKAIRKYLLDLDPHQHLFRRIPKLGLPSLVQDFLLFYHTIDEDSNTHTGDEDKRI